MKGLNLNSTELLGSATMLKVLGHPIRIYIIELLGDSPRMSVTQIMEVLGISQSAVSHHLNTLKNKRILCSERVGKNTFYSVGHLSLITAVKSVRECQ